MNDMTEPKCPFNHAPSTGTSNRDWWPKQLKVDLLNQHSAKSDPMGGDFDYAEEFKSLDFAALKKDLAALMTDSQDWWPADFGHYGPLLHPHGLAQRRHLPHRRRPRRRGPRAAALRPAQQLAGQCQPRQGPPPALADQTEVRQQDFLGRPDDPDRQRRARIDGLQDLRFRRRSRRRVGTRSEMFTGAPRPTWLGGDKRYTGDRELENPLAAVQMGLIYVNPEGPNGNPDPLAAASDIRETFARMAMNDEETVALIAGGHTFGKTHGAGDRGASSAPNPKPRPSRNRVSAGKTTSAPAKAGTRSPAASKCTWTTTPTKWSNNYLREPLRLRMGTDEEPRRRAPMDAEGRRWRRHRARCPRPNQEHRAAHAHHRPRAALRSRLRKDLPPLPRESRRSSPTPSPARGSS